MHFETRDGPELNGLLNEGEGARPGSRSQSQPSLEEPQAPAASLETGGKGIARRCRIGQHKRSLAEVNQNKSGQHEREPADTDRGSAEVTHIGIERLASGQGEKH
jgi:hypothetical protein